MSDTPKEVKINPEQEAEIREQATKIDNFIGPANLSLSQEIFCKLYTQNPELFGNATLSYAQAYGFELDTLSKERELDEKKNPIRGSSPYEKAYDNCSSAGSRLLRLVKIQERIRALLNELLRDDVIDAELMKIILASKDDKARVNALREYNKLKGRIQDKLDVTSGGKPIEGITYNVPTKPGASPDDKPHV